MPSNDALRNEYFERLVRMLLHNYSDVDLIDDIWVSGMENRKLFSVLDRRQQLAIEDIDTDAARCFLNGVHGREWNRGFDL